MVKSIHSDIDQLLARLSPVLVPGEWVFLCLTNQEQAGDLEPIGIFTESEGVTVICSREGADAAALVYDGVFRQLTLQVYSSLHAAGLIAAVADVLRSAGIPCNPVAAFHHDHLFVPSERAEEARTLLQKLSESKQRQLLDQDQGRR